jgi:hypothetical protein
MWYHHYLQHPGHTCLEETMKATIYWKGMRKPSDPSPNPASHANSTKDVN